MMKHKRDSVMGLTGVVEPVVSQIVHHDFERGEIIEGRELARVAAAVDQLVHGRKQVRLAAGVGHWTSKTCVVSPSGVNVMLDHRTCMPPSSIQFNQPPLLLTWAMRVPQMPDGGYGERDGYARVGLPQPTQSVLQRGHDFVYT